MSDYYLNFLSSVSGLGANSGRAPQDASPVPAASFKAVGTMEPTMFQNMAYYSGFAEQNMVQTPRPPKSRRKSAPGPDHIKHRRTRSGCLTCRSRRVKCDETHPVCERCRKGKRDCVYPDPPTSRCSVSHGGKDPETSQHTSPMSSNEDDEDDADQDTRLSPIPDEDEPDLASISQQLSQPTKSLRHMSTASSLNLKRLLAQARQSSETPSQEGTKGSSPARSSCTSSSHAPITAQLTEIMSSTVRDFSHLSADLKFYVEYYIDNITHYHYGVHRDFHGFFQTILISLALRNDALLHAIVAFAAYHQMLSQPRGLLPEFLKYYNKSVTMLLDLIKNEDRHELTTLLAILQLATIEEYLGDWVNLMGHQKAALKILSQLFTPQSIVGTSLNRSILSWYMRFDILVGLMGGFMTSLPRDWFVSFEEHCQAQLASEPDSLDWLYERAENRLRLVCHDICRIVARRARGKLEEASITEEHENVARQLSEWKGTLEPVLRDPSRLVAPCKYLSNDSLGASSAVAPLYDAPLSSTTLLLCEWHAIVMIHLYQASQDRQAQMLIGLGSLSKHAEAISDIFNACEQWISCPKGLLTMLHPSITIASMFLPPSPERLVWLRRKFALLESSGYIFPVTVRARLVEVFQDATIMRWWFPDDQGFTPMLQSVRAFADERNAAVASAQTESIKDMKNVFAALHLEGDASPAAGNDEGVGARLA